MAQVWLIAQTAKIVGAYLERNKLAPADLPGLIQQVYGALSATTALTSAPADRPALSAVEIRKSITAQALISFEDGKAYKQLKRHLTTRGMSLDDYRAKWGLPANYPSVAPTYSAMRSEMAKSIGLGRRVTPKSRDSKP